jgi:hypothetical protein
MKPDDIAHRPLNPDGTPTVDGLPLAPGADGRERELAHDPTNAWGERLVAGEGEYPGPDALQDVAPDATGTDGRLTDPVTDDEAHELDNAHGESAHHGRWPGLE